MLGLNKILFEVYINENLYLVPNKETQNKKKILIYLVIVICSH